MRSQPVDRYCLWEASQSTDNYLWEASQSTGNDLWKASQSTGITLWEVIQSTGLNCGKPVSWLVLPVGSQPVDRYYLGESNKSTGWLLTGHFLSTGWLLTCYICCLDNRYCPVRSQSVHRFKLWEASQCTGTNYRWEASQSKCIAFEKPASWQVMTCEK